MATFDIRSVIIKIGDCQIFSKIKGIRILLSIDKSINPIREPLHTWALEEKVEQKLK